MLGRTPSASRILQSATVMAALLLTATACSGVNPGSKEAAAMAVLFHNDVARGKPEYACSLLAPATIEKFEGKEAGSCARKLGQLGLEHASAVAAARAYGENAQILLEGEPCF